MNGSQELVSGVNIGDKFIDESGCVRTCSRIQWIEDRYFYGHIESDSWFEGENIHWVAARHVKPFTLFDVIFD